MDDVFTVVSPGDDTTQEYCPPSDVWRGENGHWSVKFIPGLADTLLVSTLPFRAVSWMVSVPFHPITGTMQVSVYGDPAVGVVPLAVMVTLPNAV